MKTRTPHRYCRTRQFNLMEIVLALGVIAVGMVSIMALFPLGMNATRDGMAEAAAANAAEQMLYDLEYRIRGNWAAYTGGGGIIPTDAPPVSEKELAADFVLSSTDAASIATAIVDTRETIWKHKTNAGVYILLQYQDAPPANDKYDAEETVDFEAVMTVWQEQVSIPSDAATVDLPFNVAVRLNAEISWPARLPYAARQTSYFTLELFKR